MSLAINKNIILGLSYGFHDASAALVIDGKVVAAATEERLTRQKHDSHFPEFAIESCLTQAGISLSDVGCVAYYEKTAEKWSRVLSHSLHQWPFSAREFCASMKSWLGGKLWTEASISEKLQMSEKKMFVFEHHKSHAAQAFLGSGFNDASILTVDAVGEWETTTQYIAEWVDGKPQFKKIGFDRYPHSLGLFYSTITAFLGFKPMNDECSTMALAAFGSDRYYQKMRKCIKINKDGRIELNLEYFNFDRFFSSPFTSEFIREFGLPAKEHFEFSSYELKNVSADQQRFADIAWAAQRVFGECMLQLIMTLRKNSTSKNLCLAGGAALNCVANSLILKASGFENLYIPRDPGDAGASIGAALLAYYENHQSPNIAEKYDVSLGFDHDNENSLDFLQFVKPHKLHKYSKIGNQSPKHKWNVKTLKEEELIAETAKYIAENKVVGWIQKGTENGPRALGYRSILFRPDNLDLAMKVSQRIKNRALFRPYALSMTPVEAECILEGYEDHQSCFNYMQLAVKVKDANLLSVRVGCHIDGTTRPQVVKEEHNKKFYKLLEACKLTIGQSVLINTSFNESGYPIVESAPEGLLMFARTELDVLIVHNTIITKEYL